MGSVMGSVIAMWYGDTFSSHTNCFTIYLLLQIVYFVLAIYMPRNMEDIDEGAGDEYGALSSHGSQ